MTKTHEFILGETDSSTDFEGHILDVEYVISSVSDDVKVVDMWRYWDSKNHNHSSPDESDEMRLPWLSEGRNSAVDSPTNPNSATRLAP